MDLDYTANNTFAQVHQDLHKYLFIRGPVGSGKSSGCIWHILLNAMKQPIQYDGVRRSRYGILRATYPALKTTVVKSWTLWFKGLVKIVYDTPIRGNIKMAHPDGDSMMDVELVFIALDREEDVNKLQSLELTGAHLNEAAEIPPSIHQMLKSRVNRYPDMSQGGCEEPFIICDYNAVPTDHWLYTLAEEVRPPKHSFYVQPPALLKVDPGESELMDAGENCYIINPEADNLGHYVGGNKWTPPQKNAIWHDKTKQWFIPHLADDYYIDQVLGAEPDWVNVMILNNYGELRSGKPVYPEYLDPIHYKKNLLDPVMGVPIIIGMDLGLTPAAAFTQLLPNGNFIIFDEIVTEDCSIRKFCDDYLKPHILNNYSKFNYELIIDPAAIIRSQNDAKAAGEIIKECGLKFRTAKTNNPVKKKEAVIYFLRKLSGLSVGPKVPYIRKGFISEFKFEKKRLSQLNVRNTNIEMFKEKWEKNIYSHIHEGVQYAALECTEGRTVKKKHPVQTQHTTPADTSAGY